MLPFLTGLPVCHYRRLIVKCHLRVGRMPSSWLRAIDAFPDGFSALMLVATRLCLIASTKWVERRYLAMETLLHPIPA
jgi:hypothetical protein